MDLTHLPKGIGVVLTVCMLIFSNVFMTFAWYAHLRGGVKPSGGFWGLFTIIVSSWCIAFFEYSIMVPANRIGSSVGLTVPQLKIIQEVITVCVFIPFALLFMGEKWRWDYLWAFLCMIGAVYFVNRAHL